jgi:hypothetical protein
MEWFESLSVILLPVPYVSQVDEGRLIAHQLLRRGLSSDAYAVVHRTVDDSFQRAGTTDPFHSASEVMVVERSRFHGGGELSQASRCTL